MAYEVVFDPQAFVLELRVGDQVRHSLAVPRPAGPCAEHTLVVAADGMHAAVFLITEEGEQGWALFALEPAPRALPGFEVQRGAGAAPQFTPNGAWLVAVVHDEVTYVGPSGVGGDTPGDTVAERGWALRWGRLVAQRVADGRVMSAPIWVDLPVGFGTDADWLVEWEHIEIAVLTDERVELTASFDARAGVALPLPTEVRLEAPPIAFDVEFDDHAFELQLIDAYGVVRFTHKVAKPSGGYGGYKLVVAPDRRHVALHLYTGQSEQGWVLFALTPLPVLRPGHDVDCGEGYAPEFTPDGSALVDVIHTGHALVGPDGEYADAEGTITEPGWSVVWGTLIVQSLPDATMKSCELVVELPVGSRAEADWMWQYAKATPNERGELALRLPWGAEVSVPTPLPHTLRLPGPGVSWRT